MVRIGTINDTVHGYLYELLNEDCSFLIHETITSLGYEIESLIIIGNEIAETFFIHHSLISYFNEQSNL